MSVQWRGRRYNASTAATEKTMTANKGTAEEGGVPGITKGNKRPGCEQMHQRKKERRKSVAKDLTLRALGIMVLTGREALALALMVIDHPGGWSQGTLTLHRDDGRSHPAI